MKSIKLPTLSKRNSSIRNIVYNNINESNEYVKDEMSLADLDSWADNVSKNRHSNGITNKCLQTQNSYILNRKFEEYSSGQLTQIDSRFGQLGAFLSSHLQSHLVKIKNIDYESIHRNIDYCSGLYEKEFNYVLKKIGSYRQLVLLKHEQVSKEIEDSRKKHIAQMQNLRNNNYREHIREVSDKIELLELSIKPIKKLIKILDKKKEYVLKTALSIGFDVREQGLVWIIKELGRIPKKADFPSFLNQREIEFIISKWTNEGNINQLCEQKQNADLQKSIIGIYDILHRKKRRELSTIIQDQVINKMKTERIGNLGELRKYLNEGTMRIIENESTKIKATKYQVIYKEATRKIHQICADMVHGRYKKRRNSRNTELMQMQFNTMMSNSIDFTKEEESIKSKQEKQLTSLVKAIRMEKYNGETWRDRSPITIISCLVGWRGAKKILEQQFNISI